MQQKGSDDFEYLVKWVGYDQVSWEPSTHLEASLINDCNRRLAALPALDSWSQPSASGCCFGTRCEFDADAGPGLKKCEMCGTQYHHVCMAANAFLAPFSTPLEGRAACFECALLMGHVNKSTPGGASGAAALSRPYYAQVEAAALEAAQPTPLVLGGLLATGSLKLVQPELQMARAVPASGRPGAKCKACNKAEGALRACNFCKLGAYHDTEECLGEARGPMASLTHSSFPWCCPSCFKKGIAAWKRKSLDPQRANAQRRRLAS